MKLARTLMLCAMLSASLIATKAANASCGNGGGQPSNGCDMVNPISTTSAAAAQSIATASTQVDIRSSLRQDQLQVQGQIATGGAGGQGGSANASGGNANATGGSATGGMSNATANGGTGGNASGGSVGPVSLDVANPRQPVSSAFAPSINATANCAIPIAGGMSFVGFSGSLGTAVLDDNCVQLEQIKAVAAMGDRETALEMMCANEAYRSTRERMGKPCLERNPLAQP